MRTKAVSPQRGDYQIQRRIDRLRDWHDQMLTVGREIIHAKNEGQHYHAIGELRRLYALAQRENLSSVATWVTRFIDALDKHYRENEKSNEPYGVAVFDEKTRKTLLSNYTGQMFRRLTDIETALIYKQGERANPTAGELGRLSTILKDLNEARALSVVLVRGRGNKNKAGMVQRLVRALDRAYSEMGQRNRFWEGSAVKDHWVHALKLVRVTLAEAAGVNRTIRIPGALVEVELGMLAQDVNRAVSQVELLLRNAERMVPEAY